MILKEFLYYIIQLFGILPLLFYLKKGSKNVNYLQFLLPFTILMFIASIYEAIFSHILKIGSTPWFRIYSFLEFYCLLYFYWKLLNRKWLSLFFGITYLLNYCHLIYEWIYFPRIGFNIMPLNIVVTSMVIVSTIIWLVRAFRKMEEESFYANPLFYVIGAILLYYCSTFIVFIVTDYMKQYKMDILGFYMIVYYANLVLRGTLVIVFWKTSKYKLKSN